MVNNIKPGDMVAYRSFTEHWEAIGMVTGPVTGPLWDNVNGTTHWNIEWYNWLGIDNNPMVTADPVANIREFKKNYAVFVELLEP